MLENANEYHQIDSNSHSFEYLSRDFFEINNWYYLKKDIKLTEHGHKIRINSKNSKVKYLTLFENNTNFSQINKEKKKIQIGYENTIQISGDKPDAIDLIIYLLEYDGNFQQVNKRRIPFNHLTSFHTSPSTVYCRIAIRLSGQGELEISNVFTSGSILKAAEIQKNTLKKSLDKIEVLATLDDEYLRNFADVVSIIPLEKWDETLNESIPDLLLVDSSWKTKGDSTYRALKRMILWCKLNKIPTSLWDVDAQINADTFREIFPFFDYIFTIDEERKTIYREFVDQDNIYHLPFAINPKVHNPMKLNKSVVNQFFNEKLAIPETKLSISGRSVNKNDVKLNDVGLKVFYPEVDTDNSMLTNSTIDYSLLVSKKGKRKSQPFISKMEIEALASGIPIITTVASNMISGTVRTTNVLKTINMLSNSPQVYRAVSSRSRREIFRNHTYQDRIQFILDCISVPYDAPAHNVTVLFTAHSKEEFNRIMEVINNQSYRYIKIIGLISVFDGYEEIYNRYNQNSIQVYLEDYVYQKYQITDLIQTKYVSVLSHDFQYDEYFVEDNIHAFLYSNAACVGYKAPADNQGDYWYQETEFEYVSQIDSYTAFFEVEAIKNSSFYELINCQKDVIERFMVQKNKHLFSNEQLFKLIDK